MKHLLRTLCCLLALCLLLPATSLAQTQKEFDATCTKKLAADSAVYADMDKSVKSVEKLKAGTCVKLLASGTGDWIQIEYLSKGEVKTGWVDCMLKNHVPKATAAAKAAADDAAAQTATSKSGALNALYQPPEGDAQTVTVSVLGTHASTILLGGAETVVATSALSFGESASDERKLAVIYAPRTGKVTLRKTASDKGKSLGKCDAGAIVPVLAIEGEFALIHYGKNEGYMSTDFLQFHAPTETVEGTALISYNGKTTGSKTVNARSDASKSGAVVAKWKAGTQVTVFSHANGWYEVEAQGVRGYVMDDFIQMEKAAQE